MSASAATRLRQLATQYHSGELNLQSYRQLRAELLDRLTSVDADPEESSTTLPQRTRPVTAPVPAAAPAAPPAQTVPPAAPVHRPAPVAVAPSPPPAAAQVASAPAARAEAPKGGAGIYIV